MQNLIYFKKSLIAGFFLSLFFACNSEDPVPQNPELKTLVSGRKILRQQEILKQLQNKKIKNFSNFYCSIIL